MAWIVIAVLILYFSLLLLIGHLSSKGASNDSFFLGNRNSPWYIVAFGMIGASLSGVTFISVPGWVGSSNFHYMQTVFGYLPGYWVIAFVLLPIYYKLNLTTIYTYLGQRFGKMSHKTGSFYFLISRIIGASFRLYLVAMVLQLVFVEAFGLEIPFSLTVFVTIALIWLYTAKGGIKTIIWTDTLQTAFMLLAVILSIAGILHAMDWSLLKGITEVWQSDYGKVFEFSDYKHPQFFWKQFIAGAFIAIVMTGLDQDMMQKNLSCRNIKEAQYNMLSMSTLLVFVNLVFLFLGALLYFYADFSNFALPEKADQLFPLLALSGNLGVLVAVFFIVGLIAAAYSSADSALTSLTTTFAIDFVQIEKLKSSKQITVRKRIHLLFSLLLFLVIVVFEKFSNSSVIEELFTLAGYTYGPLLGLFAFGLFTKMQPKDYYVPFICVLSPILTYIIKENASEWFGGYQMSFELLIINGFICFIGLLIIHLFFIKKNR